MLREAGAWARVKFIIPLKCADALRGGFLPMGGGGKMGRVVVMRWGWVWSRRDVGDDEREVPLGMNLDSRLWKWFVFLYLCWQLSNFTFLVHILVQWWKGG